MRFFSVRFAALAATVSLCFFSGSDPYFVGAVHAAEQGLGSTNAGSSGLGSGASGRGLGLAGSATDRVSSEEVTPTDNRAVDLTVGIGNATRKDGEAKDPSGSGSGSSLGKTDEIFGSGETVGDDSDRAGKEDAEPAPAARAAIATAATVTDTSASVQDNAPGKPSIPEITGNGFFTQKIAVDVPDFRGLEPKLTLSYSSARKTRLGGLYQGWAGYAWGMDGLDVIERATPGYGVPAYDTGDIYLLNGEELVACTTGMVAGSCLAGGTHVTEVENFKRVVFDSAANSWTVTDRDGTRSVFKSVMELTGSTPAADSTDYKLQHDGRYLLAQVIDTNNNTVSYAYTCPQSPVCYPSKVTYGGGASINFYYEIRPDWQIMANGLSLSTTRYRLITIGVSAGGSLRSAYKMTYDQAPISNVSRLTKVEQFGKGSTITSGVVTGANVRTIRQMTYDNATMTYKSVLSGGRSGEVVDLNSDGRDEAIQSFGASSLRVISFDDEGNIAFNKLTTRTDDGSATLPSSERTIQIGRFVSGRPYRDIAIAEQRYKVGTTSDGEQVILGHSRSKGVWAIQPDFSAVFSACAEPYTSVCDALAYPWYLREERPGELSPHRQRTVLDHDGDGSDTVLDVKAEVLGTADVFGNGRQGAILDGGRLRWFAGSAWHEAKRDVPCGSNLRTREDVVNNCVFGDVNGDGLTDVLSSFTNGKNARIWLATGRGFVSSSPSIKLDWYPFLRDLDNDGRMEVLIKGDKNDPYYWNEGDKVEDRYNTMLAWSFRADAAGGRLVNEPSFSLYGNRYSGDFNGDGLPDFVASAGAKWISQSGSGNPNLLRSVTLQTGGVVSVDYTPSTRWTNTFMPQVLH
ncbi:hypothetical protein HNQ72_006221, partial [Rhizobium wenxiniae]